MGRRGREKFDKFGHFYFVTTTVNCFEKVFSLNDKYYDILIDSLKYQIDQHKANLFAYVLMPNHIHLILHLPEGESLSDFMRDFKRHTSITIRDELKKNGELDLIDNLIQESGHGGFKLWMDRFDDLVIFSDKVFQTKVDYIHNNPVKAGLVKKVTDWKYSSARNFYLNNNSVIKIGIWEPSVPGQVNTRLHKIK